MLQAVPSIVIGLLRTIEGKCRLPLHFFTLCGLLFPVLFPPAFMPIDSDSEGLARPPSNGARISNPPGYVDHAVSTLHPEVPFLFTRMTAASRFADRAASDVCRSAVGSPFFPIHVPMIYIRCPPVRLGVPSEEFYRPAPKLVFNRRFRFWEGKPLPTKPPFSRIFGPFRSLLLDSSGFL